MNLQAHQIAARRGARLLAAFTPAIAALSRPARNERGESRREGIVCSSVAPPLSGPLPHFVAERGFRRGKNLHGQRYDARLRRMAAFTMVEIALALGVIAFALVAIIGVLPVGMSVQKDNRESTLINFDANYLMNAITSGSIGSDELTNYVIQITMTNYLYHLAPATGKIVFDRSDWVIYSTNGTTGSQVNGGPVLTNGLNIVGLLSTPKYIQTNNSFYSNYVYADFRGITASLSDLGTSPDARNFAFTYRVFPEVVPYLAADTPLTNSPDVNTPAHNFQANYTQVRLRFRWPVLPNGQMGNSRLTFRTGAGGFLASGPSLFGAQYPFGYGWYIQNGTFVGVP